MGLILNEGLELTTIINNNNNDLLQKKTTTTKRSYDNESKKEFYNNVLNVLNETFNKVKEIVGASPKRVLRV